VADLKISIGDEFAWKKAEGFFAEVWLVRRSVVGRRSFLGVVDACDVPPLSAEPPDL
jgi:hypothetical protein